MIANEYIQSQTQNQATFRLLENFFFLLLVALILLMMSVTVYGQTGTDTSRFDFKNFTLGHFDEQNFMPILRFLTAVSYVIGLWLMFTGFYDLKRYGQMTVMSASHTSMTGPLIKLATGTLLFYLPATAKTFVYSVWGTTSVMTWDQLDNVSSWADYFEPIAHMMTLVGYAAFIKGWVMMSRLGKESGGQHGTFGKAFMHIFGGVLSINFVGTINIIQNTFT